MKGQGEETERPIWQREHLFPAKPEGAPYGVLLGKGEARSFSSLSHLEAHLVQWKEPGLLVWTPDSEYCFPPEEDARLLSVLRKRKSAISENDWSSARYRAFVAFLPLFYFLWKAYAESKLLRSQELGLFAVLWLMFAGIPAYEAWKRKKRAVLLDVGRLRGEAEEVRFEVWLRRQQIPVTKIFLGALIGVFVVQILKGLPQAGSFLLSAWYPAAGVPEAGLVKWGRDITGNEVGYFTGEWWRLLTGPMLHGQLLHLVMNSLGLLYLGRRTEVVAGWSHLALVFLLSMLAGGVASAYGLPSVPSVGASGGILGLLGFLLVFELLHGKLVPRRATRRLCAALIFTFVVGFVGYLFIDNWAHGGGLLAGMMYAAIVFPKSSSARRPQATLMDLILGGTAVAFVLGGALLAVARMRGI